MIEEYFEEEEFDLDKYLDTEFKGLTKKGRVRKRKPKEPRMYFTQDTEEAILEYLRNTDTDIRNHIYNERIKYAFYKLAENIIHTFKFYYTDTDTIEELKHEVITFLLEKLHLYKQEKGAAYSYFGTIAKRYLINYNQDNYMKLQEKVCIDNTSEEADELINESENPLKDNLNDYINLYVAYVDKNLYTLFPKIKDAKTADAIIELFRKRESIDIFNKKALYIYIREMTEVETPQITRIIKKLKTLYIHLYNEYYREGTIKL
jgi:hypothetical protein